ncbi:GNAT family N-acetyltransferase, partial [Streptomyces sp. NPDC020192]
THGHGRLRRRPARRADLVTGHDCAKAARHRHHAGWTLVHRSPRHARRGSSLRSTGALAPRFGFTRASNHGIGLTIDIPDDALMALSLDASHPLPSGTVHYAAAFGV